jgi:hypothetical protein
VLLVLGSTGIGAGLGMLPRLAYGASAMVSSSGVCGNVCSRAVVV